MPPAPDPVDIPTGPMPMVERGMYTGSMPMVEPGVPAEPVIPREPFVPPELMARRRPAPHSAAMALGSLRAPALRPDQGGTQPPRTGAIPVTTGLASGPPPRPVIEAPAPRRRWVTVLLAAVAGVLVVALVVVAVIVLGNRKSPPAAVASTPSPTATVALKPVLSSFDPSAGGSGFRHQNGAWVTEAYKTDKFGGLKKGVGLLLDLGSAKALTQVSLDAGTGPLTVELRATDQKSSTTVNAYTSTGAATTASGATTLDASAAGAHRYWLIWVTELGPNGKGRFFAQLDNVAVTAKA